MRELRRIAVLAVTIAVTATGVAAAATPRYTGPRYGVPFDVRLSGTLTRTWTITDDAFPCEPAGGGVQTVRFHTAGAAHARFASTESHSPRDHFYEVRLDVPLSLTVDREDHTQLVPPPDGESCDPAPPPSCGERTLTAKGFPLLSAKHRLRFDLMRDVPGTLDDAVDKLYARGTNCLFPTAEGVIAGRVRWPGNQKAFRPGRHLRFTVAQSSTHKAWVESSDDQYDIHHTSERVDAAFTVDLRNRCRPVPKRFRKYVGYSCDAENGTIPVR